MEKLVFEFSFDYGNKLTAEQVKFLGDYLGSKFKVGEVDDNGLYPIANNTWETFTADIYPIFQKIPNAKIELKRLADLADFYKTLTGWLGTMQNVAERLETIQAKQQMFNEKCEVHVPGFGLLAITETYVETDCCTERLDDCLRKGWRILAVCPQPDQRRPDYVLGRNERSC